jgi:hypothetical protein
VEDYGRTRQATGANIIRRMRFACWVTKATGTHSEYVLLLFRGNSGYTNAPQYYLCTYIACLVITENECVYCAVGNEYFAIIVVNVGFKI